MTLSPARPIFREADIRQALEIMRTGRELHVHPLQISLIVLSRLSTPQALSGEAAFQVAVFGCLRDVITEQLAEARLVYDLPLPDNSCTDRALEADFSQNNLILEAWSFLYYRYVCVLRDLSMQQIEIVTGRDQRLLRHRQTRAIKLLTENLILREQIARQQEITRRLRLALPVPYPPKLIGVESMVTTALDFLIKGNSPRHLVLQGPEGIGKTVLAQLLAYRMVEENVLEDMLWINVSSPIPNLTAFVHSLVSGLGLPATSSDDPVKALRAYLLMYPTLIVLDQAGELLQDEAYTNNLLTTLGSASVILTSRTMPAPDLECYLISLRGLNREQAFTFLETIAYQRNARQNDEDRFETIWAAVGGNPIMLRTVFSLSRILPISSALSRAGVIDLYERLWGQLPNSAQHISLIALFFLTKGVTYQQISVLSRLDYEQIDRALLVLVNRAFLVVSEDRRYSLLPAPATFLSNAVQNNLLLENGESVAVVMRRILRRRVDQLVDAPDAEAALDALDLAGTLSFSEIEYWEYTFKLAPQITSAGRWLRWRQHLATLLQYEYSSSQLAWIELMIGTALRWLGQLDEALHYLERARVCFADEANPRQAEVMGEIAVIYRYRGDWQSAGHLLQEALDLYTRLDDSSGVERCLHELAQVSLEQEDSDLALAWLDQLPHRTMRSWGIAGLIYALRRQNDQAYEAALHIQSSLEESSPFDSSNYGRAVATLGLVYDALGKSDIAVPYLFQAVDLLERAKDMVGYARACNNLSVAYLKQPAHSRDVPLEEIITLLTSAQRIQEHIGDRIGLAITQQNLSWLSSLESMD